MLGAMWKDDPNLARAINSSFQKRAWYFRVRERSAIDSFIASLIAQKIVRDLRLRGAAMSQNVSSQNVPLMQMKIAGPANQNERHQRVILF